MRQAVIAAFVSILVVESALGQTEGSNKRTWSKVQYLGGALDVRGKSLTWKNDLLISPEVIQLSSKDKVLFQIDPKRATALTYERQRLWKPSDVAASAAIGAAMGSAPPFVIVTLAMKNSTKHYIAIEFSLPDGHASGVLLRAHKNNFKEIVSALRSVTGIREAPPPPPASESKDRKPIQK